MQNPPVRAPRWRSKIGGVVSRTSRDHSVPASGRRCKRDEPSPPRGARDGVCPTGCGDGSASLPSAQVECALTIAGSDPTGGAGLQADLQVFRHFGVHGAGVITALTVQDSGSVHRVLPSFPSVVLEQLRVLLKDFTPSAIKLGMLATDDVALNVELGLRELENSRISGGRPAARVPIVVDPVLAASDGTALLERRAWARLQDLIGRATLVTPNLPEAQALTDCDVSTEEGVQAAATALVSHYGAEAALIKGGHAAGPPRDLLATRQGGTVTYDWFEGHRMDVGSVHGTGCALAAAVTALLARGDSLPEAVGTARTFVRDSISRSEDYGKRARFLVY
ncbi:bifunctional hydroxymethylpyrimidine kinase/phosphomethylpyrimidine kinase [Myxococcota bacterium]|nr:bifunctional hydroxymethylpyrimidine kinase/phosphomethylpyrimidine kinase [Myxococcota bacterium]